MELGTFKSYIFKSVILADTFEKNFDFTTLLKNHTFEKSAHPACQQCK